MHPVALIFGAKVCKPARDLRGRSWVPFRVSISSGRAVGARVLNSTARALKRPKRKLRGYRRRSQNRPELCRWLLVADGLSYLHRQLRGDVMHAMGALRVLRGLLHHFLLGLAASNEVTP